jgi:sulfite exporter TauE/SafE
MDIGPMLGGRMELDFLAGVIAGFAASLHCLTMCGGVAAAIAVNAGASRGPWGKAMVLLQAQLARVGVYIALGVAAGAIGWGFHGNPDAGAVHALLRWLAALTLVVAAYAVAEIPLFGGAAGRLGARIASPVYRRLHHLHRFGPAGLGAAWGLMPCAMVYIATFYAGVSGGAMQGGLIMAGFGLGTIPALTILGAGAGALTGAASNGWLKGLAALALLALAGVTAVGF